MVLVLPIYAALVNLMLLLCKRQQINVQRTITHEKVVQVPVESLYLVQGNQLVSSTIDTSNTLIICLFLFFFNLSWKVCFPVQFTSNLTDLLFPVCTGQVAEEKENYQTRYSNWLILPHGGGILL